MIEPFSPDGPQSLLAELCALVGERAPAESDIVSSFHARNKAAQEQFRKTEQELTRRYEAELAAAESEYATTLNDIRKRFDAEYGGTEKLYTAARSEATDSFESQHEDAQKQQQEARWEATTIFEAARGGSELQLPDLLTQVDSRWKELQAIGKQAGELLERRGQSRDFPDPQPTGSLLEHHPMQRFTQALDLARHQYRNLESLKTPRLLGGLWLALILVLLWLAAVVPCGLVLGWNDWPWVAASLGIALVLFLVIFFSLRTISLRQTARAYLPLRQTLLEAGINRPAILEATHNDCRQLFGAIVARHRADIRTADEKFAATVADLTKHRDRALRKADETYRPRLAALTAQRDQVLAKANAKYPPLIAKLKERYASQSAALRQRFEQAMKESVETNERQWAEMTERWQSGLERFSSSLAEIGSRCEQLFPDWSSPAALEQWRHWTPPTEIPPAVRFGQAEVKLSQITGGLPKDPRLMPAQTDFTLPLVLPFPKHSLFLLKAAGEGRDRAVDAIQSIMLRLLTAMPPGKVRFTILDPVGLGENFSAFMHLADYDDQLVASRIWTDSGHIEQRLSDLTGHMENVIQVYLRNEFQSIDEYNRSAGEMAEPYRVLVVADFPANFSDSAAHRLKSIVASGARCGVFVLVSVDTKLPLPRQFHLADLEADALSLSWNDGQFSMRHPDYGPLPIQLDEPPAAELFTEIVRTVGHRVKDASRVEVPFRRIVPEEPDWWTTDSRAGIDVPLGPAGAMKLQHLELGKGTSQHVLISGKTGSGKSTLLHVLITNLALRYSPDEVELYLVDFKKGVEFKAYARYALPHARVIAIESEREFGLSVLEHLDSELRIRGDRFRKLGVQDLKGFRTAEPGVRLPRILILVDEFQELFVDDDRTAQEAALLLDRLVRQGRAFGIHVLLGSQTLGGAYSLARSTIGQMAVRIALQCSEGDAHLILSEDNTAARLLTRPGEAIYNDANGVYEGNHPFQIVWISDTERDDYLRRIANLAEKRKCGLPPAIVFEGNVLSDLADNVQLRELLSAPQWPEITGPPRAWLGSAVAITDPTAASFLRQSGCNLMLAGHREEAALGVMSACLLSLAAQTAPSTSDAGGPQSQFYVLDGTRPDAPEVGFWASLLPVLPHATRLAAPREAPEVLAELSAELARRQEAAATQSPPVYLLIYNAGRFRDLRKEEEFSFGGSDDSKPASPAKQFATIVREGPAVGIHTLMWCDSYSTLNRLLDRQALRDFELRVLFQMNATDSANLMESPDASRLGVHRAIFYDEGQGRSEKFRPYGLPSADWLTTIRGQLHGRNGSG